MPHDFTHTESEKAKLVEAREGGYYQSWAVGLVHEYRVPIRQWEASNSSVQCNSELCISRKLDDRTLIAVVINKY